MPKGMVERSGGRTAASDLRDMLRRLEVGAGNLEGKGEGVLDVLHLRDEVQAEMDRLLEQGLNLKSEETRLETVDAVIARHAKVIEKELRKIGGLAGAREKEQPSEDKTWWFVDVPYYADKKRRKRTTLISVAVVLVVVVVAAYVSNLLWGPNAKAEKARASFVSGQQYMARQDWDAAIEEFQRTLRIDKNRGEAYVYLGVLYEITDQSIWRPWHPPMKRSTSSIWPSSSLMSLLLCSPSMQRRICGELRSMRNLAMPSRQPRILPRLRRSLRIRISRRCTTKPSFGSAS